MTRYEIVVKGRLTDRFTDAFELVETKPQPGATILVGDFTDQAHLDGMLERLRNLGIEPIRIRAIV